MHIYREGDQLLGGAAGVSIEFVPQSDTAFIMLSVGALDEAPVEFVTNPDGSVMLVFLGQQLGLKK